MNTHDNRLKDLLADRIKDAELPVPDHLWSGIASRLSEAAVSGPATAGKASWGLTQWTIAAVIAGAIVTGVNFLSQDKRTTAIPIAAEQESVASEDSTIEANQHEQSEDLTEERKTLSETTADSDSRKEKSTLSPSLANTPSTITSAPRGMEHDPVIQPGMAYSPDSKDEARTNEPDQAYNSSIVKTPEVAAEPLTAAFSARQVDAETLRWLFIPQEDDAKSYSWSFGDGHVSENMAGAHSYNEEGIYEVTLTVTDETGNTKNSTQEIDIIKPAVIRPVNVFTPNGDARNDLFDPLYNSSGISRVLEWAIFDASNRIVFSSETQFIWDGRTIGGENCPDATYRYYINALDARGNPVEKSGLVRLMR